MRAGRVVCGCLTIITSVCLHASCASRSSQRQAPEPVAATVSEDTPSPATTQDDQGVGAPLAARRDEEGAIELPLDLPHEPPPMGDPAVTFDMTEWPFYARGPVATIDDREVTAARFNAEVDRRSMQLTDDNVSPQLREFYKKQMVHRIIDETLLEEAVAKKKITVSDDEVQQEYDEFVARFPSKEQFEMYFERSGMLEEEVRADLRKRIAHEKLLSDTDVSDAEARAFYDEHITRYEREAQVKASHILFKLDKRASTEQVMEARAKALEVSKLAKKKGADFGELAKKYSEGPSGPRGGDLGLFPRKRMVKPFSEAAFNLNVGEVSGPVRTDFGFHVIKVFEKKPARVRPFEEVKDTIISNLSSTKISVGMTQLLGELKEGRDIEIIEDNIVMR